MEVDFDAGGIDDIGDGQVTHFCAKAEVSDAESFDLAEGSGIILDDSGFSDPPVTFAEVMEEGRGIGIVLGVVDFGEGLDDLEEFSEFLAEELVFFAGGEDEGLEYFKLEFGNPRFEGFEDGFDFGEGDEGHDVHGNNPLVGIQRRRLGWKLLRKDYHEGVG